MLHLQTLIRFMHAMLPAHTLDSQAEAINDVCSGDEKLL